VWGKYTYTSENLPMGLRPSPVVAELGFEVGDQIISVDGTPLENVMDINKYLLLRDIEKVTVRRKEGSITTLTIPEDVGSKMFESGELIPLNPVIPAVIDSIIPNSPAAVAGLQSNDKILVLNGTKVENWTDFQNTKIEETHTVEIIYERNRAKDTLSLTTNADGTLGVFPKTDFLKFNWVELTLGESIVQGFDYGYWTLRDYVTQFKYIFTPKGASQLGGFGAIGNMFPSVWDWKGFWSSTALISIILAFMNILPIPALDGGHVMFLCYEILTGRKPNDKFMEYAQMFGFFLLLSLVLYANGNDLYRAIFN